MVWRNGVPALLALSAMTLSVEAFNVNLVNQCGHRIELFDSRTVEGINVGATLTRYIAPNSGAHVFRHSTSPQATLAEFSGDGGMAWFDISIIPTGPKSGPDYCPSLDDCKAYTGGVGFNVPMQIKPLNTNQDRCRVLTCMADGCNDAYQYPKDDTKTHTCPLNTDFEVIFCPGGPGGKTPAPTPAPTPPPTPSPTPTPTPSPTPTPTPTPSPTPSPTAVLAENENAVLDASNSDLLRSQEENRSGDNEAGVAETETTPEDTTATAGEATTPEQKVQDANTQSEGSDSTSASLIVVGVMGCAAAVAGAAIYTIRKKKAELEAMDEKSPAFAGGNHAMTMSTPRDMINVL